MKTQFIIFLLIDHPFVLSGFRSPLGQENCIEGFERCR